MLQRFLARVRAGEGVEFDETMSVVDDGYLFTPTAFRNGGLENAAGVNNGSCKIFAFARLHGLTPEQTLALFGRYYWEDVMGHPDGSDHGNIRNFMRSGWAGVEFDAEPLAPRVDLSEQD